MQETAPLPNANHVPQNADSVAAAADGPLPIDIIVPVYADLNTVRRCINSIRKTRGARPFELIIIDDASPDRALRAYLTELQQQVGVSLIRNPENLGLAGCAEIGIGLHPRRDVVLLHSDTEVFDDWLDRLHRAAYSGPRIASVTPFSNHAGICSYPRSRDRNPIPAGWHPALLDRLFAEVNRDRTVEIPVAVDVCLYLTRAGIAQADPFQAGRAHPADAALSDYRLRLGEHGFRHLLAGDVFIYHRGKDAGTPKSPGIVLDQRPRTHPENPTVFEAHIHRDPERALRRRIDIARLQRSDKPRILLVTHCQGGGTERHVQELSALLASRYDVFVLRPTGTDATMLDWAAPGEEFHLYFQLDRDFPGLLDTLSRLGIGYIHYHHLIHHHPRVWQLAEFLSVPFDFTVHDYYSICPQITLTDARGNYCGEPDAQGCDRCLSERPAPDGLGIRAWRARYAAFLSRAGRVLCPSEDVRRRLGHYFALDNLQVLPHPSPPPSREIRVVVIGRISDPKGGRQLVACARDAEQRELPIVFTVIGTLETDPADYATLPVIVTGHYEDSHLDDLIAQQRPDVVYFPAQWPETYSYTLDAAIRTRRPILAPRLGAFPERLEAHPCALCIDHSARPEQVNDLLLQLASPSPRAEPPGIVTNVLTLPTSSKRIEHDQARD